LSFCDGCCTASWVDLSGRELPADLSNACRPVSSWATAVKEPKKIARASDKAPTGPAFLISSRKGILSRLMIDLHNPVPLKNL
jgi:hypothetical protein